MSACLTLWTKAKFYDKARFVPNSCKFVVRLPLYLRAFVAIFDFFSAASVAKNPSNPQAVREENQESKSK